MKKIITLLIFLLCMGTVIAQELTLKEKMSIIIGHNWHLIRAQDTEGQMYSLPNGLRNRILVFIPKDNVCYFYFNNNKDVIELKPYNITDQMLKIGEDFNFKYILKDGIVGYNLLIWDPINKVNLVHSSLSKDLTEDYLKDRTYKPFKKVSLNPGSGSNSLETVKSLQNAADNGDADAMNKLGNVYRRGQGVAINIQEAFKWYLKGANNENLFAMVNLARAYEQGQGVTKDMQESVKWYQKAANKGQVDAMYGLSSLYYNGDIGAKNYQEALKWSVKAYEAGRNDAKNRISWIYESGGYGVKKDEKLAQEWKDK